MMALCPAPLPFLCLVGLMDLLKLSGNIAAKQILFQMFEFFAALLGYSSQVSILEVTVVNLNVRKLTWHLKEVNIVCYQLCLN
jgi:hypothetical protein